MKSDTNLTKKGKCSAHLNFLVVLSFFIVPQYMALKSTGSSLLINSFLEIRFILIYNIKKTGHALFGPFIVFC